jgi:hypothetical protein
MSPPFRPTALVIVAAPATAVVHTAGAASP